MTGQFCVCAVPIGNMKDITYRAVEVLKQADFIACEDTRVTRLLTDKYNISAKLIDYHKFNEKERCEKIISLLTQDKTVVLVSDAGTPLISDPGSILIEELLKNNIKITPLPGACALTTFLCTLPRSDEEFAFIGFIPRQKNKQIEILDKYKNTNCVFYESPLRLMNTLENIQAEYGQVKISIGRELTKIFEEVITNSISNIIEYYKTHPLKGEIVVMIYSHNNKPTDNLEQKIKLLKSEGFSTKDISKIISSLFNENKNKIYKMIEKQL